MTYLKSNERIDDFTLLEQNFRNEFTLTISDEVVVKMRNKKQIDRRDTLISKILFDFTFATLDQLYVLTKKENETIEEFREHLEFLVRERVINKFMLSSEPVRKTVYDDAYQIFCLDLGGKFILEADSDYDVINWRTTRNMKGPSVIKIHLHMLDFYLSLNKTCPLRVRSFRVKPELRIGKTVANPSLDMSIATDSELRFFIVDIIIGEYYTSGKYKDRIYQLEALLSNNTWKKYYGVDKIPMLLFVTENDVAADEVARFIHHVLCDIKDINFALTTPERMSTFALNEAGGFMKYKPEVDALVGIRAKTFNP